MNGILVCLVSAGMIGIAIGGTVVGWRVDAVKAEFATVQDKLTTVQAERDQAVRDRTRAVVVLTRERDRAVAAERQAAGLLEQIAKDAGTDRDGPTAPTLRDAVEALTKGDRT